MGRRIARRRLCLVALAKRVDLRLLDAGVPVGGVGGVQFVAIADPLHLRVFFNEVEEGEVELWEQGGSGRESREEPGKTHVAWDAEEALDVELCESIEEVRAEIDLVGREFPWRRHGGGKAGRVSASWFAGSVGGTVLACSRFR